MYIYIMKCNNIKPYDSTLIKKTEDGSEFSQLCFLDKQQLIPESETLNCYYPTRAYNILSNNLHLMMAKINGNMSQN
jgi:hypothetical protein